MGWMYLVGKDKETGLVGDSAWDLAGDFVDEMVELYHKNFGRLVTLEEIISCVEFAYAATPDEYLEKYPKPLTPDEKGVYNRVNQGDKSNETISFSVYDQ